LGDERGILMTLSRLLVEALPLVAMALSAASVLLRPCAVAAQLEAPSARTAKLAEEFSDPLTTLPQLFVQDAYTPASYGTEPPATRLIARVRGPRIPRITRLPLVQLVRPSFSVVTIPTGKGRGTVTAFGDMQLFDLAVIPWPSRASGLTMAVGPIFVFPTATDERAGQGAWQVGPAFGTIYKGIPGILLGALVLRVHLERPTVGERAARPTHPLRIPRARLLREVRRRHLDHQLASRHGDDAARERRARLRASARGLAADQSLRQRRVDGLPPVCASRSADHRPLRPDDGVSGAEAVVAARLLRR
jgi:hypothetical protein